MNLKDRLWLWCHNAGVYNTIPGLGQSHHSPAEAARCMGLRNLLMVVYGDKPEPPFAPVQRELAAFDRVVWSVIGDAGSHRNHVQTDVGEVVALRREFPNIAGGIMDDFFNSDRPDFALSDIVGELHRAGLPLWVVLYDLDLGRENLTEKLGLCDVVTFWTWSAANLPKLKDNMARVKALAPGKSIVLGCYLWDFGGLAEMSVANMEFQCGLGREWLADGTIDGMIMLGSPLVGMDLPAVEWTRDWIASLE